MQLNSTNESCVCGYYDMSKSLGELIYSIYTKLQVKDWKNMFQALADVLRSNDVFVKIYVKCSADGGLNMKDSIVVLLLVKRPIYSRLCVILVMCFRSGNGCKGSFRRGY